MFKKNKYYTIKEVSEMSGIQAGTLYKRLYSDQLPVKLVNGVYNITGNTANKLLVRRKPGPKTTRVNLVD